MSDNENESTMHKVRWGRLKRSNSHDDAPVKPRNLKSHVSSLDMSSSNHRRVFRPRKGDSRSDDGLDRSNNASSSKILRFRKQATSGGYESNDVSSSPGIFGLRRRRGGKNPNSLQDESRRGEHDAIDYNSDNASSDNDAMSSSADGSNSTPHKQVNRGRRPNSSDYTSRALGSALRAAGKHVSTERAESVPPRRVVSFGDVGGSPGGDPRARASSSDQHLEMKKTEKVSGEGEGADATFGYNMIDFPMHANTSTLALAPGGVAATAVKRSSRERARYSVYHGSNKEKKKLRVRPYHCFSDNPLYLAEEEIYADSLTLSKEFIGLKSYLAPSVSETFQTKHENIPAYVQKLWGSPSLDSRIGALRVEVLGCVRLNRTKPDISVYMVCGDSAFCTDVISNYRSPMWPSVSRRACIFPIHHAFAKLYVGVFDVCIRKNKENDSFCGRVSIDVASLRPNTEYDTTMPLRASTFIYDKRKRGVIRLRFSLHWFDERAAVVSYFKPVKSLVDSCPLVEGLPTIPCADPKTFRNVAITVYGQDLPGKFSKNAFRATVREMILYQQNMQQLAKVHVLDAMLYEKPLISLYLFSGAMYCVRNSTVGMVPAIFMGYIIILYIENYMHFIEDRKFTLGYKPLTIVEVMKALTLNRTNEKGLPKFAFHPTRIEKRAKRRRGAKDDADHGDDDDEHEEIVHLDHREFPFADRDAYPKFGVEDSLAPGTTKGDSGRLHGRLSVYYTAQVPTQTGDNDDSDSDSDHDEETVMTESHMIGDSVFDLDSEDEDDSDEDGVDFNYKRAKAANSVTSNQKRLRLGPPQDTDVKGKKVPPQLALKKFEALLYKISLGVSVEPIHAPPRLEQRAVPLEGLDKSVTGMTAPSPEVVASVMKRSKKTTSDDFDKLLGLESGNSNPITRIMSSFMGPLMRMIRVAVYLIRVSFNVSTWRDPYLSFWVLILLFCIWILLIIFPWRIFFFVVSLVCLGPQNVFVRRYLEKKAATKALEKTKDESSDLQNDDDSDHQAPSVKLEDSSVAKDEDKSEARRGFFSKRRHVGNEARRKPGPNVDLVVPEDESVWGARPAFESALHGQSTSSKKVQPRAVAIPYTRLKKERFYDWPPDPTVSRATPMIIYPKSVDDSLSTSVPSVLNDEQDDKVDTQERNVEKAYDIPDWIEFVPVV